jgi:AcrR family transcriptional regulator
VSPRLPAARRRRQLLDVALQVFAERGFHDASMNDIAEAAGVTKPVLYQHFRSKRELFGELLSDVGSELQEAITKAVTTAQSSHEMVELGFAAYFRYVAAHRDAFNLFYGIGFAREDEFAGQVEQVENTLAELVAEFIEIEGLTPGQRRHPLAQAARRRPGRGGQPTGGPGLAGPAGRPPQRPSARLNGRTRHGVRGEGPSHLEWPGPSPCGRTAPGLWHRRARPSSDASAVPPLTT